MAQVAAYVASAPKSNGRAAPYFAALFGERLQRLRRQRLRRQRLDGRRGEGKGGVANAPQGHIFVGDAEEATTPTGSIRRRTLRYRDSGR